MKLCVQVHASWKLHGVEGSNKEISRFVKVALGATGRLQAGNQFSASLVA